MTYKLNPFTGKLDTSDGPQGPAGVVSAAGPGSQGTPSISFAADLDTGLYNYTPNGIAVSTGGTGRLFVDANGRVGIGTASPGALLHLNGTSGNNQLWFGLDGTVRGLIEATSDAIQITGASTIRSVAFATSGVERARVDTSGRLLVGTSSESAGVAASFQGSSSSASGPGIVSIKTGTTNPTSGNVLGYLQFRDAASQNGAQIIAVADGNWATGDGPTRLVFSTTADGASSPTERVTIKSTGIINFSNAPVYADNAAATTGGLAVGDVYRTSTGQLMIRY